MRPRTTPLALSVCAALALAACSNASSPSSSSDDAKPRPIKPVAGCGADAWTDPADLAPDRAPARCKSGAPAPKPLKKPRKLTVVTGTLNAEYVAPLQMAVKKGEFKKEGLDVQLKTLPTPDALPLLAKGEIDAQWAAPEAAVINGINSGFDIKWTAANYSSSPKSRSGLWVKLKNGETAKTAKLDGLKIGTMIGKGSVIMYAMEKALKARGTKLDAVDFQQLGSADVLTALQNGGVDSAWLLDPAWRKVDGDADYGFIGGQPEGEPLGGVLFGPSLLNDDRAAGVAFTRAYVRTLNTYFRDDYKKDPAFVTELAKMLKVDESVLKSVPSLTMDWEIRKGTTDRLQKSYTDAGVTKGDPLPEDKLVDRAFYAEAVGHKP
ncbi:ABC transporter substrate-binding protein [Streptomyces boninensis]|uniref:ABC transporter substrate-binding protein n=1 Tax=Streptomyces boninensis TaxID=2039455 RepID=UPI003B21F0F1